MRYAPSIKLFSPGAQHEPQTSMMGIIREGTKPGHSPKNYRSRCNRLCKKFKYYSKVVLWSTLSVLALRRVIHFVYVDDIDVSHNHHSKVLLSPLSLSSSLLEPDAFQQNNHHQNQQQPDQNNNTNVFNGTRSAVDYGISMSDSIAYDETVIDSARYTNVGADTIAADKVDSEVWTGTSAVSSPYAIPQGKAMALPSTSSTAENKDPDQNIIWQHQKDEANNYEDDDNAGIIMNNSNNRNTNNNKSYSNNKMDMTSISPAVWKYILAKLAAHSVIDIGCGHGQRGISTSWFITHGISDIICVDSNHQQSLIPLTIQQQRQATQNDDVPTNNGINDEKDRKIIIEHDFTRGPWWPEDRTYDIIWCVDFLEHVSRNYHTNFLPTFRKAALIFVTSPLSEDINNNNNDSYRRPHVEIHENEWWIQKFEMYGFKYSNYLTEKVKQIALKERGTIAPNGAKYDASNIYTNIKVFFNPLVASLPEHGHILAEHGCHGGIDKNGKMIHRECGADNKSDKQNSDNSEHIIEPKLPESYYPYKITSDMDQAWAKLIKHITPVGIES